MKNNEKVTTFASLNHLFYIKLSSVASGSMSWFLIVKEKGINFTTMWFIVGFVLGLIPLICSLSVSMGKVHIKCTALLIVGRMRHTFHSH